MNIAAINLYEMVLGKLPMFTLLDSNVKPEVFITQKNLLIKINSFLAGFIKINTTLQVIRK